MNKKVMMLLAASILGGCAHAPLAELNRSIPTQRCERILQSVPLPKIGPNDDARVAFMKDEAALITANGRIRTGRNCIAHVRRSYKSESNVP